MVDHFSNTKAVPVVLYSATGVPGALQRTGPELFWDTHLNEPRTVQTKSQLIQGSNSLEAGS